MFHIFILKGRESMKRICAGLLALLLCLTALSVTALASGENEKATITDNATGATATFDSSNSEIIRVTFSSASLTAGQQYLVLMVKGSEGDYTITDKTILYIDQTAAAADEGGLHDYAHKEWSGLLRDFYYQRWQLFLTEMLSRLRENPPQRIDFYATEEAWTLQHNHYTEQPNGDPVQVATEVMSDILH